VEDVYICMEYRCSTVQLSVEGVCVSVRRPWTRGDARVERRIWSNSGFGIDLQNARRDDTATRSWTILGSLYDHHGCGSSTRREYLQVVCRYSVREHRAGLDFDGAVYHQDSECPEFL
jgi:hypothetical protein